MVTQRPQLRRKTIKPVRKWKVGNLLVYDFGVEICGYPQFTLDAQKEGVQFEIGTGERLDSNNVPLIRASGDHSAKYTTKKGVQSWRPFTWAGFRYFSMESRAEIQIQDISAEFASYRYENGGSFECSDKQLTDFWNVGKHTLQINSIDTYQDPWREHTQYIAGDSRYMQIYGNYAFGKSSRFLSAYNLLSGAYSQRWRQDGAVRSRYPTDFFTQPGSSTYLADYQLEWVLMMHEYFKYYGKDELIEQLYSNLKSALEYYLPFIDNATGLLSKLPGWIVLDWPATYGIERKDIITALNCQYYGALNAAAAMAADFQQDTLQARKWKGQAARLKENINKHLWSAKDKAYRDSYQGNKIGQQSQVYALLHGLADSSRKRDLARLITHLGKASEQSFAYWTLNAMFDAGEGDWALKYMRKNWGEQTHLPSFNGAWHEGWDLDWGATSHAWSSGPTALLSQKILGLEPIQYGWKSFLVKPITGDLMWAKGFIATVSGNISVSWNRGAANRFVLELIVPHETTAFVHMPSKNEKSVKVNGKAVSAQSSVRYQIKEDSSVVLALNSGTFLIECDSE
jgi:hypothetical protein